MEDRGYSGYKTSSSERTITHISSSGTTEVKMQAPESLHVEHEIYRLRSYLENLESEFGVLARRLEPVLFDDSAVGGESPVEMPFIAPMAQELHGFGTRVMRLVEQVSRTTRTLQI